MNINNINKKIIEEVEVKPTLISNFISIIKPYIQ
jgi:hypothetical protein